MSAHPSHSHGGQPPPFVRARIYPGDTALGDCSASEWVQARVTPKFVPNLLGQFQQISQLGDILSVWPNSRVTQWPRYTNTADNNGGMDNHYQGIQRLNTVGYAALSGGDPHTPMAHLFVARLESRPATRQWGSNLGPDPIPEPIDRLVARIDLNSTLWHAGGMSLIGDIIAIPIENSDAGGSRIEFLNLAAPEIPTHVQPGISRAAAKAGAVALTRLPDGRFLVAVWSDSEIQGPSKHLDLYASQQTTLLNTGWDGPFCFVDEVTAVPKFQAIDFLWESAGASRLYLAGFENEAVVAPDPNGRNYGALYEVTLPNEVDGQGRSFALDPVGEQKDFHVVHRYADMDAANGVYVDEGGKISVYCAHHFIQEARDRRFTLRFQEFVSAGPDLDAPVVLVEESRVELFEEAHHAGHPLLMIGPANGTVDDLELVTIGGRAVAKRASSLRCKIPDGFALILHRKPHWLGDRPLVVKGTGQVVEIPDLGQFDFDDVARSCNVVAKRVAETIPDAIWV